MHVDTPRHFNSTTRYLVVPVLVLVGVFVAWPTAQTLLRGLHWSALQGLASDGNLRRTLWFTTWQACASTAVTLLIGLPITALLSRVHFRFRSLTRAVTLVPFILPTLVVGMAMVALLPAANATGAVPLIAAHAYLNIAVVVRIVGARWETLPLRLNEVASTLGANRWKGFLTVSLPLLRESILGATGLVFMFCFGTYGAARVLAGPTRPTVETEIYRYSLLVGDLSRASVLAVTQILFVGVVLFVASRQRRIESTGIGLRYISELRRPQRLAVRFTAFLVCVLMAVPVLALLSRSFERNGQVTVSHWVNALRTTGQGAQLSSAIWSSLRVALVATTIAVLVGLAASTSAAYTRSSRVRRAILLVSSLPVVVSAVILGLGYILTFRNDPVDWRGSWWLLPIAHGATALPFVVRSLTPAITAIPSSLRDAASVLGATPFRMWRDIDLALIKRPLAVSASLAAAISLGEFGATSLLSRRGSETLTMSLGRLLGRPGTSLQGQAFVVASVLALLSVIITLTADRISTKPTRAL